MRSPFSFARIPGQLPELDGLRGIAVLLVLLRHAVRAFAPDGAPVLSIQRWDVGVFFGNGWIGVDLFFVLSGFLIAHHILALRERAAGRFHWRLYLGKRVLRIVPAYYAVLALAVLGAFPGYEFPPGSIATRVAYHLLFLQDYLQSDIVVAFWSLGVEEKFYLIAPLLVLAGAGSGRLAPRLLGIAAILALGIAFRSFEAMRHPEITNYAAFFPVFRSPFHMTLDPILMGVMLAILRREAGAAPALCSRRSANLAFAFGTSLFLVLTCSSPMMGSIGIWDKTLQPTAIALAFAAITHGLLFGCAAAPLFRGGFLRFYARISYSLYLVHLPLVPLAFEIADGASGGEAGFAVFLAVFTALSTTAALVLHFAVERPFLAIKERIR